MIVPLTAVVTTLLLLMGGIAVSQSVFANGAATGDRHVKRALQAADAGLASAVYRMNVFNVSDPDQTSKCVTRGETGSGPLQLEGYVDVEGDQWCRQISEDLGDGASYSYYVGPESDPILSGGVNVVQRTVVSTGTAGGETRRVATNVEAPLPAPLFGKWAVASKEAISLNSNSCVRGSVRTNAGITGNSGGSMCGNKAVACLNDGQLPALGDSVVGPGFPLPAANRVCGTRTQAPQAFTLPTVGAEPATNENYRICAPLGDSCTNGASSGWNPVTRRLELSGSQTITLGGSAYSFCRLKLDSDSKIIIPSRPNGPPVKIYIDRPEDCTGQDRGGVEVNSNAQIVTTDVNPTLVQIYVQGSETVDTEVELNSNAVSHAVFYAPESDAVVNSNAVLLGAIAARSVYLGSNAVVKFDRRVGDLESDSAFPLLRRNRYRECQNPAPSLVPDAGC